MGHYIKSIVCLIATLCTGAAFAQVTSSQTDANSAASSSPVAYVYVTSAPTSSTGQINGYSAATNGALTAIPGSPFHDNVSYMAVNGAWLFGVANQYTAIDSFSIATNGSLALKGQGAVLQDIRGPSQTE